MSAARYSALLSRNPGPFSLVSRWKSNLPAVNVPKTIVGNDVDKFDLQANKAPEERLEDLKTHTGQKWDSDDYRLIRFTNVPKLVNQRQAIDLINEVPPIPVEGSQTFCDGGGGPLGHPKVFINVDKPGNQACGYCGLRFYKDSHGH